MADSFYIGMDLCPDVTQISYFDDIKREPVTINQLNNKETYMMPNILFYSMNTSDWYVGSEASETRFKEQGIVIDELYENAYNEQTVDVDGVLYTYRQLFIMMIKMHLNTFLYRYEGATVKKLVITLPKYDKKLHRVLMELALDLGIDEESVYITSHIDSALYYIFNQSQELWKNNVALFDFGAEGLNYYQIDIIRSRKPETILVNRKDLSSEFNIAKFSGDNYTMDTEFVRIAEEEFKQSFISSVFLTGLGFSEKWMNKSRNFLCQNRRLFAGQNIYTKGACYRAVGGIYDEFYKHFFVETEENVKFDIGITLGDDEDTYVPVAIGGIQWYNIKGRIYVILDDTDSIDIIYKNRRSKLERRETVKLYGMPKRPNKTSKFSIEVDFENPTQGAVVIKDVAFGKMYPSTSKIYRKEFEQNVQDNIMYD